MRIFVYLGLRTTGAFSLHRSFDSNRAALDDIGVFIPNTGYRRVTSATLDAPFGHAELASNINLPEVASRANYFRKALIEELVTSKAPTAVISSEAFLDPVQGLRPARVRAVLGGIGTIHPVIYLRRQDVYVDALYREMLCMRDRRVGYGFDGFVRKYLGPTWLDYAKRIAPWIQEFGAERVTLRSFDDVTETKSLAADFISLCSDVVPDALQRPGVEEAPALDPTLTNLLRAVNEVAVQRDVAKVAILERIMTETELWSESKISLVDAELWADLRRTYSASNDELIKRYLSGPSERLRFEPARPPTAVAQQIFTMPQARQLVRDRWPGLSQEEERKPIQELVDITFSSSRNARQTELSIRVGVSALIKAPLVQIRHWINFHLNAGIDHIMLFVDGPPFFDELRSTERVTVVNCDEEFWHNMLVVRPVVLDQKLRPIRELGHAALVARGMDWTAAIDGDELLCGDLHSALKAVPTSVDAVRVPPAEAVQHDNLARTDGFEARVFKLKPLGDRRITQAARHAYDDLSDVTLFGFFGHSQGKSIVRSGVVADFWGSHNVVNTQHPIVSMSFDDAILLHFETRPYPEWKERWMQKLVADNDYTFFSQIRFNQYRHLESVFKKDENGLRELYDRWYYMSDQRIRLLQSEGLLARVDIPDEAFQRGNVGY